MRMMYEDLSPIVEKYKPDVTSIEAQFFSRNIRTLRSLAESVGGMKLTILLGSNSEIHSYQAKSIKLALAGSGKATKVDMVKKASELFSLGIIPDDEADAIGCVMAYIKEELAIKDLECINKL